MNETILCNICCNDALTNGSWKCILSQYIFPLWFVGVALCFLRLAFVSRLLYFRQIGRKRVNPFKLEGKRLDGEDEEQTFAAMLLRCSRIDRIADCCTDCCVKAGFCCNKNAIDSKSVPIDLKTMYCMVKFLMMASFPSFLMNCFALDPATDTMALTGFMIFVFFGGVDILISQFAVSRTAQLLRIKTKNREEKKNNRGVKTVALFLIIMVAQLTLYVLYLTSYLTAITLIRVQTTVIGIFSCQHLFGATLARVPLILAAKNVINKSGEETITKDRKETFYQMIYSVLVEIGIYSTLIIVGVLVGMTNSFTMDYHKYSNVMSVFSVTAAISNSLACVLTYRSLKRKQRKIIRNRLAGENVPESQVRQSHDSTFVKSGKVTVLSSAAVDT